ncbi:MAG: hypothetical protein QNJ72_21005 [Pleurocapsa sp. MO_226.B13]|nr:hypothetical protein [Pleurocapsa sp. MO_226.B13]
MIKNTNSSPQPIERESEVIYNYLCHRATRQQPEILMREFRSLFTQGKHENLQLSKALEKIIFSPIGQQQFPTIFSHCFYLILNCWLENPDSLSYIPQLLNTIDLINRTKSYDRRRKQLIKLIQDYQRSPSYLQLRGVLAIINPQEIANLVVANEIATDGVANSKNRFDTIINTYLARYTYLYQYFTPENPGLEQLNNLIQSLQRQRQQDFEFRLSQHIIYRFRLKQIARLKLLSKGAGKVLTRVENPSLLSEKAFKVALSQYLGKLDRQTIKERSRCFSIDNQLRNSYKLFKQDLYLFLTENIQPRNNYQFKPKLQTKLEQIFPQSNNKPINKTLILQTCRQLFSFLIIDVHTPTKTQKFTELVANLGTAQVAMILIKIALICPESKTDLEKKIASIVNYYQLDMIQDVPWVIKTLEHLLIAFSIYFGDLDVSIAQSVVSKH